MIYTISSLSFGRRLNLHRLRCSRLIDIRRPRLRVFELNLVRTLNAAVRTFNIRGHERKFLFHVDVHCHLFCPCQAGFPFYSMCCPYFNLLVLVCSLFSGNFVFALRFPGIKRLGKSFINVTHTTGKLSSLINGRFIKVLAARFPDKPQRPRRRRPIAAPSPTAHTGTRRQDIRGQDNSEKRRAGQEEILSPKRVTNACTWASRRGLTEHSREAPSKVPNGPAHREEGRSDRWRGSRITAHGRSSPPGCQG